MKAKEVGWNFPSNGGGTEAGFNDSGIETYAGTPFQSLAREIIQNSLDARLDKKKPVVVSFDAQIIESSQFPGHEEMLDIMKKCLKACEGEGKGEKFFEKALRVLRVDNMHCLKISDYNTTGLRDGKSKRDYKSGQWHRLVKATGQSAKESNTAGGSYGIGKNAPYVVSDLRTVFYSTRYKGDDGKIKKYAQGKSILVSHQLGLDDYSQATGYYGDKSQCMRLEGGDIPHLLRPGEEQDGTTIMIPGLTESGEWREKIIAATVSNYFDAIRSKILEIRVDGETIDAKTLSRWFANEKVISAGEGDVEKAKNYYDAITASEDNGNACQKDLNLEILGRCTLRIIKGEDYPKSVAILRRGMKITDELPGLKVFSSAAEFVAVCVCEDEKGRALLRRMENPAHDKLEPERLGAEVAIGKNALKELAKSIREEIRNFAEPEVEESTPIEVVKEFLSSNDDEFAGDKDSEKDFDGGSNFTMKRIKRNPYRPDPGDNEYEEGIRYGEERGKSKGNAKKGDVITGNIVKQSRGDQIQMRSVRVIPESDDGTRKIVMFTASKGGLAKLFLRAEGDSFPEDVSISAVKYKDALVKNGSVLFSVPKNVRVAMHVRLNEPVNAALSVFLVKPEGDDDEVDSQ